VPERLTGRSRAVATAAEREAGAIGASMVGAEHLLLALARDAGSPAGAVLAEMDLTPERLLDGLVAEWERSLAAAGVHVRLAHVPAPEHPPRPRWAASGKLALRRAVDIAIARYERPVEAAHLLLGVLAADHGTAPRVLECAGADREALRAAALGALDAARAGRPRRPRAGASAA
jgi:ATP-dependent Clp protease ATP-binding subunit ClpA